MLSTTMMAIKIFGIDVQILKFRELFYNICAHLYDLSNHL